MGLDVAVEFATLGEYRLVEADSSTPDVFQAAPLVRRPARSATTPDLQLLPPASTAIARAAAQSAARAAARRRPAGVPLKPGAKAVLQNAPRRRPTGPSTRAPKQSSRKRAGAVEAGTQLCLFSH